MALNYCTNCGFKLQTISYFCSECGAKLVETVDHSQTGNNAIEPSKSTSGTIFSGPVSKDILTSTANKFNFKHIAAIVILIVVIGLLIRFLSPSTESKAIAAAKNEIIAQGTSDSDGEVSNFKFSDIETKLLQKEDRDLEQEGRMRVSGRLSYTYNDKTHYHFFGTTVRFYEGKYDAGTVSFETDYDSYEKNK